MKAFRKVRQKSGKLKVSPFIAVALCVPLKDRANGEKPAPYLSNICQIIGVKARPFCEATHRHCQQQKKSKPDVFYWMKEGSHSE